MEVRPKSIRVSFTLEDGTPERRTLMVNGAPMAPTLPNIKFAHRMVAEIRERIRHGTFSLLEYFPDAGSSGVQVTVGRQLDAWLAAQRLEASSRAGYKSAIKFWKEVPCDDRGTLLGDRSLRALKHSDTLTALAQRPGLSGKTVNNYVSVLRQACELAVLDRILPSNPVAAVPRASWQREPPDPFTRDEAEAIIADMLARQPEPIGNLVEWRFFTGVRTSEMAGLRWASVGLSTSSMQVREAIVRGVEKGKTKTAIARDVILNSRALAALQRQRKHTQVAGEHVWLDPRYGTPWLEERAFRRSYWEPTLKRLGIRYRPPNNMRHTYATMMLMAGMTPAFCAKQLGHSIEMFLRTYSKWLNGEQNDIEMQRLESAISSPKLPQEMKTRT